jgi:hypothetical protein
LRRLWQAAGKSLKSAGLTEEVDAMIIFQQHRFVRRHAAEMNTAIEVPTLP